MTDERKQTDAIADALARPFDPREIKWKPQALSKDGNRALAIAYVDARVIQDRLDEVVGIFGWQDRYDCLPDGSVTCRLRVRIGDEWITKMDVGGQSEQPDEGDRRKAAFSDALKRTAVKFGIGRYLYRLPQTWADYDNKKKCFVRVPTLPPEALPKTPAKTPPPEGQDRLSPAPKPGLQLPQNGQELLERLATFQAQLVKRGLCKQGDLIQAVEIQVRGSSAVWARDLPDSMSHWPAEAIELAVAEARIYETARKAEVQRQPVPQKVG